MCGQLEGQDICRMNRYRYRTVRAQKWLGKRPYDQRRSSAVRRGALDLTRCLEMKTRCGVCSVFVP